MTTTVEERTKLEPASRAPGEEEAIRRARSEAATTERIEQNGEAHVTCDQIWTELSKASFAVIGYVTPRGDPRSSGVMYKVIGRRLYAAVGRDSWKARHIAASGRVSVTVPVRRGGLLSLMAPIPPATITFHGTAVVHPPGSLRARSLREELASLLPEERQATACVIEILPEETFLTYGIGVSLSGMRDPVAARGRAPVRPGGVR